MKLVRLAVPLFVVLALAVVIEAYVAESSSKSIQQTTSQRLEPDKEQSIRNALAALLAGTGVRTGTSLPTFNGKTYKELRLRWQNSSVSPDGSQNLLKEPGPGAVTLLTSAQKNGTLPQARSLELSPNQILAVALDKKRNLKWWLLLLDPRLVRAETPGSTGEVRGETYYLANVDFTLAFPNNPEISEIQLYHPRWTGNDFRLELLSTLPVE
jgi:hypothetical protein